MPDYHFEITDDIMKEYYDTSRTISDNLKKDVSEWSVSDCFHLENIFDCFLYNICDGGVMVDNNIRITLNYDGQTLKGNFKNIQDAMLAYKHEINEIISKVSVDTLTDLTETLLSGAELFALAGGADKYLTLENQQKWMNLITYNEKAYADVKQLNESFIESNMYDTDPLKLKGFRAINDNGRIIVMMDGNELCGVNGKTKTFSSANEAYKFIKDNMPENSESFQLNTTPFKDRTWMNVPPEYRTNGQQDDSFKTLDMLLKCLHMGNVTIPENAIQDDLYYGTVNVNYTFMNQKYTICTDQVESAIMSNNMHLGQCINDTICHIDTNSMDEYIHNGTPQACECLLSSKYLSSDWLEPKARLIIDDLAIAFLTPKPDQAKMVQMDHEIEQIQGLMECVGLCASQQYCTVNNKQQPYIEISNIDDGSIYSSDEQIRTGKAAVLSASNRFDDIFLNGEICCNYTVKDFDNYTQAYWTCLAMNDTHMADMIQQYCKTVGIEIGSQIDVPLKQNKSYGLELDKSQNGDLYLIKNGNKIISRMTDIPYNRIQMSNHFNRLVKQEKEQNQSTQLKKDVRY